MRLDVTVDIPFSREKVFKAYRDDLPKLVPYLENVRAITVTSRSDEGPIVKLVNRWKGGGEIPSVVRKVVSEDLMEWDDLATWNESDSRRTAIRRLTPEPGTRCPVTAACTTTDGATLLHFHAALLQPAIACGHPVQPLALQYRTPDDRFSRAPAYDGELSLGECIANIIAAPRTIARITVAAPIATADGADRRTLAARTRGEIATAIGVALDAQT